MAIGTRRRLGLAPLSFYLAPATASLLLTLFLHAPPLAGAQPLPWQLCDDPAGNYTEGGAYQANIRALASGIPKNASSSPALFAKGAAGRAPDAVYALALCRGDTASANASSSCASCVAAAFRNAQQLCAYSRIATMYDDPCILRYSDREDFLANVTDNGGKMLAWNANNVSADVAPAFDAASGRLVNATADYAAADPRRRFGTGELDGFDETYPKIYSLAQCTPDMTAAECRACLGDMIGRFTPRYFVGKPGGRVFGVRCNFRFETYSFFSGRPLLQLPGALPPAPAPAAAGEGTTRRGAGPVLAITLPIAAAALLLIATCVCFWKRRKHTERKASVPYSTNQDDIQSIDSLLLDLSTLRAATDNFAESNKLGEGGFGAVYKGVLSEGEEIAVKRLSQSSRQGTEELKTELVLVANLQHKNLVRLVGVCLEEQEKLLVYEYMPNRSLDTILFGTIHPIDSIPSRAYIVTYCHWLSCLTVSLMFVYWFRWMKDPEKSRDLDWGKRLKIVGGVARGLQYLHEDSQLRIIHRDLKASNVLLDMDFSPKISDFGLAKLFGWDESQAVTSHIAGTYGYMAPEYAMRGQYSAKSDAYSFGVLVLEILTGRRNSSFANSEQSVDLLSLVWEHWTRGTVEELVDPSLGGRAPGGPMLLKLVNVGLLCVQDSPADRPAMSAVNVMLSSSTVSLQAPSRPTFCIEEMEGYSDMYSATYPRGSRPTKVQTAMSPNEVSITELEPR
ncbi:cysteine-rich receptor-like protein kinase 10 isoform X1 [Brachypodium distachyon]|uniref:cysteine-rich receptor-like protein kinase 10 isoform X1 n=1 Tax=Brachypodium distachyon TaxID=15368 RepID=UPI000D0DA5C3|nr:cysteine-rich receptor-like protein kinase 10 isoform X1 [Brachypodium distachyon]|eukprot:XP_024313518.1 cysteine-rich receptor-like protein kinase 10 isoform X1 [Brachypodium distachyon]